MSSEAILTTTQPIRRFPREPEDDKDLAERSRLTAYAWRLFSTHRKVRIELGRTFIGIRDTFDHGDWGAYYNETFGATGVTLHTVRTWMRWAREADVEAKKDAASLFKPAADEGALKTGDATARAEAEVGHRPKQEPVRPEGPTLYRLPLHLTGDRRDRTDELRRLPKWPQAEEELIVFLDRLHVKYGVVKLTQKRNR